MKLTVDEHKSARIDSDVRVLYVRADGRYLGALHCHEDERDAILALFRPPPAVSVQATSFGQAL